MFILFCKNVYNSSRIQDSRSSHVFFLLRTQSLKFYSNSTNQHSPTVSYLISKCGFSLDSAISVSQKIQIKTTKKPDSVLQLLKSFGFTQTQITDMITKRPSLILSDSTKTLKPKLEFFESVGMSKPDIAEMLEQNQYILKRSLTNYIIPLVNMLKRFLHTNEDIFSAIKSGRNDVGTNFRLLDIEPNVLVLRQLGVPELHISKMFMRWPRAIMQNHDQFKETVRAIVDMKIDRNSTLFLLAISMMSWTSKPCWERKIELFKSFGWSEEDALVAFKLQPNCIGTSEKKIRTLFNFYLNDLGLSASDVNRYPNLLLVSLEKRIIPRCSVLLYLLSNGFIEKSFNFLSALNSDNKRFEYYYVKRYEEIAPDVWKAYQGKLGYPKLETLRATLECVE